MNKIVILITAIALSFLLGFWQGCNNCKKQQSSQSINIDTTFTINVDTNYYSLKLLKPLKPVTIFDTAFLPALIDTNSILQHFFSLNIYNDTFTDKNLHMVIVDTIQKNQITSRNINYKILRPDTFITVTKTVTNTIPAKPINNTLAIGAVYGNNIIMPSLLFTYKKVGIGAATNFNNFQLNLNYTIWKN
jgi:hypothetical protein